MNQLKFLLLVFGMMGACSPRQVTNVPGKTDSPSGSVDHSLMLQLVNKARSAGCRCGDTWYGSAPSVTWNTQLESAASAHSRDMFRKKYFSHTSPDGSTSGDRIRKAGYNWKLYGENIATGQTSEEQVVASWLNSPGHCKNIMNKNFTEIGAGREGNLWTLVLAYK